MPTYEYRCRACGHVFDIVQKMSEDPLTVCPECGGELRKVFAPPAIAFKGSGFYATDHGKKKLRSRAGRRDGSKGDEAGELERRRPKGEEGRRRRPTTGRRSSEVVGLVRQAVGLVRDPVDQSTKDGDDPS